MVSTDWMDLAKCRDRDVSQYALDKLPTHPESTRQARLHFLCGGCPVISDCAGYALRVGLTEIVAAGVALPMYPKKWHRDQLKAIRDGVKP